MIYLEYLAFVSVQLTAENEEQPTLESAQLILPINTEDTLRIEDNNGTLKCLFIINIFVLRKLNQRGVLG